MSADITSELHFDRFKIRFGGVLHLSLVRSQFVAAQAWRGRGENSHKYIIEFTMSGGEVTAEYDTEEKWKAVLSEIDKHL